MKKHEPAVAYRHEKLWKPPCRIVLAYNIREGGGGANGEEALVSRNKQDKHRKSCLYYYCHDHTSLMMKGSHHDNLNACVSRLSMIFSKMWTGLMLKKNCHHGYVQDVEGCE